MNVFENNHYGEARISADFYAALAKALGATDLETETNGAGRMTVEGVRLCLRQGYGAKARKMTISAYAADNALAEAARRHGGRPVAFPEATVDPTRPLEALARDIAKRLIEKSAPGLASIRQLADAQTAAAAEIEASADRLRRAFPVLTVTTNDSGAQVYGRGVSARMHRDGSLYFDRISADADKAARILAIMLEA